MRAGREGAAHLDLSCVGLQPLPVALVDRRDDGDDGDGDKRQPPLVYPSTTAQTAELQRKGRHAAWAAGKLTNEHVPKDAADPDHGFDREPEDPRQIVGHLRGVCRQPAVDVASVVDVEEADLLLEDSCGRNALRQRTEGRENKQSAL